MVSIGAAGRAGKKVSAAAALVRLSSHIPTEERTMSEFAFLFRGDDPTARSPEQMQKSMQKWLAWFKQLNDQGIVKDPGHPLERSGKVVRGERKSVHDGPFAEAKDIVNGYILVEAEDLPHAVEISKGCPILEAGGSIEVRPIRILKM
jgi:hypothetical protein